MLRLLLSRLALLLGSASVEEGGNLVALLLPVKSPSLFSFHPSHH
ncbi:MAG: hypothetical protein U1D97_13940 [Desulfuromonadales bacterium]|nr:hypothetical protein [Desulfuromonadales bacterium]